MNDEVGAVLVVGAGIPGIQAATDLANMGFRVHLVESTPSIGGRMAQLDKTFPTNDCSICILAPKMIECYQHENVNPFMYSEVVECSGRAGDFKVKVRKKPTYVDWEKCIGCGDCTEKCPKKIDSEFNVALDKRKAAFMPFLQAVPKKATIDHDNCIYFQMMAKGKPDRCKVCQKVCPAEAIDFEQQEDIVELEVGAIIVSIGFDFYDMNRMPEYGYGTVKNVMTAMEFERCICASGPTHGHLYGVDGENAPRSIAFIQCAGSRDLNHLPYCTSVCCMHSTKEAILANEHYPGLKSYIFYMDLRAVGKGFQEYLARAEREYSVSFVRSRVGRITESPDTGRPVLQYEDTNERLVKSLEVDMVVLAQALVPSRSVFGLSKIMGFDVDEWGFIRVPEGAASPMDTTVPGIFACGYAGAPQDIPESVAQASGAAARAAEVMAGAESPSHSGAGPVAETQQGGA